MFGFGKNKVKGYLDVPEELYDAPFAKIVSSVNPDYLENAVVYCFDKILTYRKPKEFHFFRMFESWTRLFIEKLDDILPTLEHYADFRKVIDTFPEITSDVYEFLLNEWIYGYDGMSAYAIEEMSIIDDILIPMSDYERYQYHHFSIIREKCIDILDASKDTSELWDILQVLEEYFDIPRETFSANAYLREYVYKPFLDSFDFIDYSEFDDSFCFTEDEIDSLKEFFRDREAYEEFMDHLPELLKSSGLELYALLIKILGPNKEVMNLHDSCREFISAD